MSAVSYTLLPMLTLMQRELVRFYRQPSRIVGSLGTPILFWVFLGSGLGTAFPSPSMPGGRGFLEFFFPGNLLLGILFTAIFCNISVIEDRGEGFLQSVLVAPVSRRGMVAGKVGGGSLIAFFQGLVILCLAPLAGIPLGMTGVLLSLPVILVTSVSLTALGFAFAWHFNSVQGFHSIMNLVLLPMWLLSGSFFPAARAPFWLRPIMYANPLTYGMAGLERAFYHGQEPPLPELPSYLVALGISCAFGVLFYAVSIWLVGRRKEIES